MYSTLIAVSELKALDGPKLILDCRYQLMDKSAGRKAYSEGHIPGALFVSVDDDLASVPTGLNGRHPLPDEQTWLETLRRWGVRPGLQVVVYDDAGGAFAARAWWLFRWVGHEAVAVLDGGWPAWVRACLPIETEIQSGQSASVQSYRPGQMPTVTMVEVKASLDQIDRFVVDARAQDRFRGENETVDPVGGHIPGAKNRFFKDNLTQEGLFKRADVLREEWLSMLAGRPVSQLISQCGSGVTACHNLLSLEIAGLSGAALYPGSWSEWCSHPENPVAQGN